MQFYHVFCCVWSASRVQHPICPLRGAGAVHSRRDRYRCRLLVCDAFEPLHILCQRPDPARPSSTFLSLKFSINALQNTGNLFSAAQSYQMLSGSPELVRTLRSSATVPSEHS